MPADFTIKQGDTSPVLTDTLTLSNGSAQNLTGCTVNLVMRNIISPTPIINDVAAIVSAAAGTVSYTFNANETSLAGDYQASWAVTFANGTVQQWPTDGYIWIRVEENLTTPGGQTLVSLGQVKDYLNIPASDKSRDAKLQTMIEQATSAIEHITGNIIQRTYQNEMHDGGAIRISLLHHPVVSVTEVVEYWATVEYPLQQIPVGRPDLGTMWSYMFEEDRTIIRRAPGGGVQPFYGGTDSVRVSYVAGLSTVPGNVVQATCELIRVHFQQTQQGRPRPGYGAADEIDTPEMGLGFYIPHRVRELLEPNTRHPSIA